MPRGGPCAKQGSPFPHGRCAHPCRTPCRGRGSPPRRSPAASRARTQSSPAGSCVCGRGEWGGGGGAQATCVPCSAGPRRLAAALMPCASGTRLVRVCSPEELGAAPGALLVGLGLQAGREREVQELLRGAEGAAAARAAEARGPGRRSCVGGGRGKQMVQDERTHGPGLLDQARPAAAASPGGHPAQGEGVLLADGANEVELR